MTARKAAPASKERAPVAKKRTSKLPQPIDGTTGKPLPLYRAKLGTLIDVRRELAKIYRRLLGGQLEPSLAGRAGFLLSLLARVIADSDIENRILALEKHANELETRTSGNSRRNA